MARQLKLVKPIEGLEALRREMFATADEFCKTPPVLDPKTMKNIESQKPVRPQTMATYAKKLGLGLEELIEVDDSQPPAVLHVEMQKEWPWGGISSFGEWPDNYPEHMGGRKVGGQGLSGNDMSHDPDIRAQETFRTATAWACDATLLYKILKSGRGRARLDGREVVSGQSWKIDPDVTVNTGLYLKLASLERALREWTDRSSSDTSLDALVNEVRLRKDIEGAIAELLNQHGLKIFGCCIYSYFYEELGEELGPPEAPIKSFKGVELHYPFFYIASSKYQECKITYLAIEDEEDIRPF